MTAKFRTGFTKLTPSWLHTGEGELVLYSIGLLLDMFVARMRWGFEARFPTRAGASAQKLIGRDRGIPRGRAETNEHYAQRLIRWRWPRGHRTRGSAFALAEQLSEFFGGVATWTIDQRGNRFDRDEDGIETALHGLTWDWDGTPDTSWGRFWVGFHADGVNIGEPYNLDDPRLWAGLTIDEAAAAGYTLDATNVTEDDVDAIDALFAGRAWKPAGTLPITAIISFDGTYPTPDGTWDVPGNRSANYGYWELLV